MAEDTENKKITAETKSENKLFAATNIKLFVAMLMGFSLLIGVILLVVLSDKDKTSFARLDMSERSFSFGTMTVGLQEQNRDFEDELAGHIELELNIKIADIQLFKYVEDNKAIFRDAIINNIEERALSDLYDLNDKKRERKMEKLRRALRKVISKNMPKGELFKIYFSKYFIQKIPLYKRDSYYREQTDVLKV